MMIARADTAWGEIALRDRDGVTELVVNGVFAMDSREVTSELALADAAGTPPGRVLVGGLGLGYTAARLLDAGADLVQVVELAEPLIGWARTGVTEQLGRLASDPRVQLTSGDIADAVRGTRAEWDAILLDVDNGPSFLIHDVNAGIYTEGFLARCLEVLTPTGQLVIWCEEASARLAQRLRRVAGGVELIPIPVTREGRSLEYALYRATPAPRQHHRERQPGEPGP